MGRFTEVLKYNQAGLISQAQRETFTRNFLYNENKELISVSTQATMNPTQESWMYDLMGNRTNDSSRGQTTSLVNQVLADALADYNSDPEGLGHLTEQLNKNSGMTESFAYRADGQLTSYSSSSGTEVRYYHDALDRRIAKHVITAKKKHQHTRECKHDHDDESTSNKSFTQAYLHLGEKNQILLAQSGNSEKTLYINNQGSSAGIDEHLGQISRSDTKAYVSDHLGSIINGEISGRAHAFGNFGELLRSSPQLTEDSSPVMYGFTGRQYDPESSRYYYRARMYDPATGRFMTRDPIGLAGGDTNLYRYVGNDPINFVDPSGLLFERQIGNNTTPAQQGLIGAGLLAGGVIAIRSGVISLNLLLAISGGFAAYEGIRNLQYARDRGLIPDFDPFKDVQNPPPQTNMCSR